MYSAVEVAEYVIHYYKSISNLKLQKVLYFLQANHLVLKGKPLFEDEIEAVDFGPIVWSVYDKYKVFGGASIPKSNKSYVDKVINSDKEIMNRLLDELKNYSSSYMLNIIQNQAPWLRAKTEYRFNRNRFERVHVITHQSLIEFFKEDT